MSFILYNILRILELLLLARIIISWVQKDNANVVTQWICRVVDTVLRPIQKILPTGNTGIDFSPIILFILIDLVKRALFSTFF